MLANLLRLSLLVVVGGLAMTLRPPDQASAIVHLAEIHEIMVGADGDPDVQFIEINMRLGGQNITANDFDLLCPSPENNAGQIGFLGPDEDSDGLPDCNENDIGTDDTIPDTDGDGCLDGVEVGPDETVGGRRDPLKPVGLL